MLLWILILTQRFFNLTFDSNFLKLVHSYLQCSVLARLPSDLSLLTTATALFSLLLFPWTLSADTFWYCWIMPTSQLYGSLTRKLYDIWRQASVFTALGNQTTGLTPGSGSHVEAVKQRAVVSKIQQLFHGVNVYPTESQVYEMIQCANRFSLNRMAGGHSLAAKNGATGSPSETAPTKEILTFGEFCYFASVLMSSYRQNIPPPKPFSHSETLYRKLERARLAVPEDGDIQNEFDTNFEVFLGGSCNPTRWRSDIVIPELKRQGVTYYNPQVDDWYPELIELENYAKQNSEILFFVVDNQTRAIASMIEVAFLASNRKLILVINDLPGPKWKIVNDELSLEEFAMLSKGRAFLRDVVERQGIPIFGQISLAVKSTVRVLRDNIWPQDLTPPQDEIIPVKMGHVSLGDKMIKMLKIYESSKNQHKQFTFADLAQAYRTLTSRPLKMETIKQLARCHLAETATTDSSSTTSSPSLSRSSSSDEPEEEHFEVVATASAAATNNSPISGKKPKSRSKKSRKMKKLQDIFPSESSADSLPPLGQIVITFDQFCCIISELDEQFRQATEEAAATGGQQQHPDSVDGNDRSLLQLPGKMFEKVSNMFNVFSILKNMLSIPVEEPQQQQQQQRPEPLAPFSRNGAFFDRQPSNQHHPLHPSRLYRASSQLSHSFPSRSSSPVPSRQWSSSDTSSLARHSPMPYLEESSASLYASSYSVNGAGGSGNSLRAGLPLPRSASPSLFRHRHSYSSPSPNHLAPHSHHLHHQASHSPIRSESPLPSLRRGHYSSTSSITSLLYDNLTDLYIGGSLGESHLQKEIIPLLKKSSITFNTLKSDRWTSQRMIPLEAKNIEKSRVLLFLITKGCIDISFMIMAAHYIGLGYDVVLCIQNIDSSSPFVISDGKNETWLSTDAIKDYNRGRCYLSDLATKVGVPVFSDIDESIDCCIQKILTSE